MLYICLPFVSLVNRVYTKISVEYLRLRPNWLVGEVRARVCVCVCSGLLRSPPERGLFFSRTSENRKFAFVRRDYVGEGLSVTLALA